MAQIVKFAVLTGLRPGEVIESVKLFLMAGHNSSQVKYYNPERQALEHFRFPEIFLRTTKEAYISFVTVDMIEGSTENSDFGKISREPPSYTAIRQACRKRGIHCDLRYGREIFASYLSKEGLSDIMVDMLQGRTPKSVLVQHYLTPSSDYRQKILAAVVKLKSELEV